MAVPRNDRSLSEIDGEDDYGVKGRADSIMQPQGQLNQLSHAMRMSVKHSNMVQRNQNSNVVA